MPWNEPMSAVTSYTDAVNTIHRAPACSSQATRAAPIAVRPESRPVRRALYGAEGYTAAALGKQASVTEDAPVPSNSGAGCRRCI